jgi:hypothetical protein
MAWLRRLLDVPCQKCRRFQGSHVRPLRHPAERMVEPYLALPPLGAASLMIRASSHAVVTDPELRVHAVGRHPRERVAGGCGESAGNRLPAGVHAALPRRWRRGGPHRSAVGTVLSRRVLTRTVS